MAAAIYCDIANAAKRSKGTKYGIDDQTISVEIVLQRIHSTTTGGTLGADSIALVPNLTVGPSFGRSQVSVVARELKLTGKNTPNQLLETCKYTTATPSTRAAANSAWLNTFTTMLSGYRQGRLPPNQVHLDEKFTVTNTSNAGLSLKFLIVSASLKNDESLATTQQVKLILDPTPPPVVAHVPTQSVWQKLWSRWFGRTAIKQI